MTSIVDLPGEAVRLIRSDSKGRVLVAAEQRDALLDAFEQSGQSAMAFCRQHGLKYPTFATWVQKRRRASEPVHPRFAEVNVDLPALAEPPALPESMRVTLADGTRIDISCRKQLAWAMELLRHLSPVRPC
jgi:hypothetical protein